MSRRSALIANLLLLGFLAGFALLELRDPDLYYRSVQEDQALEWASFWSFFVAGGVFAWAAARQRKMSGALPWFLLGVALFCVFVAMEEISWAQRVFGHRPPEYFLAENYQQELNLHNIASKKLRLLTFRGIVLGYGVVLPLIALLPVARRWLDRLGVVVPPIALAPSMFAMFWLHLTYPWKFTGEVVECGVGFGFLFIALAHVAQFSKERGRSTSWSIVGISGLVVLLAFTTAWWSQNRQAGDPMDLGLAEVETESLASDLLDAAEAKGRPSISKCGFHKRVYTVVEDKRSARPLRKGRFAGLVAGGLPEARAEFFLDPWNSPYWIRDRCDKSQGRRVVFVYSFGPNRIRDSNRWKILGDDIGKYVLVEPKP